MIAGIFHQGSGLGNQLHRYVATRVAAADKGVDFGMIYNPDGSGKEEGFKGKSFMNLDLGRPVDGNLTIWNEQRIDNEQGVDVRPYDESIRDVQDGTLIEGEFQDERYWMHRADDVNEWLGVEPLDVGDDECVVGFRGGEFSVFPELFLPLEYWNNAIRNVQRLNRDVRFRVVTDDPDLARLFFPQFPISHEIGYDWRSMRYANYAIIANSSFYILPRWLRERDLEPCVTIAPMHWARHNVGFWALPQNKYGQFMYQDQDGDLHRGCDL